MIQNITDTAYWVAYYRAKESLRKDALFHDPFAELLAGDHGRDISKWMQAISRYVEWSVVSRTVMIDRFIEKLLQTGTDAVINLGAGLDARPYRLALPNTFQWIEADYPSIISYKEQKLSSKVPSCRLTRVAVDLADSVQRREFLKTAAPEAKKVVILTEGVIPYLTPAQVGELAQDLLVEARFQNWITEYFDPRVYPYLKKTDRANAMKNSPFQFYPDNWFGFFQSVGWVEEVTCYSGEIAREFGRDLPMPAWAKLIFPLLPQKVKDQSARMTGFTILKRG